MALGKTPYADVAIERAIELANHHHALITGATAADKKQLKKIGPVPPGAILHAAKRIENAVEKFAKRCKEFGISMDTGREDSDPYETMTSACCVAEHPNNFFRER